MPEFLPNRNSRITGRLNNFCEDCLRIGSTDCVDHGGAPSGDARVLGKRYQVDAFEDFTRSFLSGKSEDSKKNVNKQVPKRSCPSPTPPSTGTDAEPSVTSVAALSVKASTVHPVLNVTSEQSREQASVEKPEQDSDEIVKEGGVRYRENLGKFVVEYRPPRFKWKLWMGTYGTLDEGRRACDCARFYAGQDKATFYFKDSPDLFRELGPLTRPFARISKDAKDKAFNLELKKRAKAVIRKMSDAQKAKQVDVTRPTALIPNSKSFGPHFPTGKPNIPVRVCDQRPSSSQESLLTSESPISPAINCTPPEANHLSGASPDEVASTAVEAGDPFANLPPLSVTPYIGNDFPPYYVSSFNIPLQDQTSGGIQSSLEYEDPEGAYINLWDYER